MSLLESGGEGVTEDPFSFQRFSFCTFFYRVETQINSLVSTTGTRDLYETETSQGQGERTP